MSPVQSSTQASPRRVTAPSAPCPVEPSSSLEDSGLIQPFVPRRWLGNGHAQTIIGNFLRRTPLHAPPAELLTVAVEPAHLFRHRDGSVVEVAESSVLCLCHWQPEPTGRLTVVLVHGLEGSASSGYVLGNTALLWAAGCNVVRMNMRSCGGSDALSPTIYHSGRSEDVAAVVNTLATRGLGRIALVGYSMGGNLVLRYAGQQALLPQEQRNPALHSAVGVSPLLDLAPSSAALHRPANRIYERRFLRAMTRRLLTKARLFPAFYEPLLAERVLPRLRSMRDFDGEIVARYGGFHDADDYYEQVRSSRFASALAVPTLILHSADDPFIRTLPATRDALQANPQVRYMETAQGGHCAFLSEARGPDGGRWAEATITRWLTCGLFR